MLKDAPHRAAQQPEQQRPGNQGAGHTFQDAPQDNVHYVSWKLSHNHGHRTAPALPAALKPPLRYHRKGGAKKQELDSGRFSERRQSGRRILGSVKRSIYCR